MKKYLLLLVLCLVSCGPLGNSPSKGIAEATFILSNGYGVGVEGFTHPSEHSDCKPHGSHITPGFPHDSAASLKADDCARADFEVPPGFIEHVTLAGLNCRFGNSPFDCGAKLVDRETGKVLANTGMSHHENWYSAPVQNFEVQSVISGHLSVIVEQHATGKANYAHQDYPSGHGTVSVTVTAPDGAKINLDAVLTTPGPNDFPGKAARTKYLGNQTWSGSVTTEQNPFMYVSLGTRNWPSITVSKLNTFNPNPYEIGLFVQDQGTHAILAYVNFKATGEAHWTPSTFYLQGSQSGQLVISLYMWEVHSANWLNPPLANEALDIALPGN